MWMNGCPRILWNLSLVLWVDWWTVWCWKKSVVPQSCPTLWDPMDCSLPGFSVLKIFQARILEWVAISSSRGSSRPKDRTWASCIAIRLFMVWATKYNTTAKQSHTWVFIKKMMKKNYHNVWFSWLSREVIWLMWIYMDFCTFLKGVNSWSWDRISNFEGRDKRKSVEYVCEVHIEEGHKEWKPFISCWKWKC